MATSHPSSQLTSGPWGFGVVVVVVVVVVGCLLVCICCGCLSILLLVVCVFCSLFFAALCFCWFSCFCFLVGWLVSLVRLVRSFVRSFVCLCFVSLIGWCVCSFVPLFLRQFGMSN